MKGTFYLLRLEEVNPDNWRLGLHVKESQKEYVSNTILLLARAYAYREDRSRAVVIYNNDTAIGMALYYDCNDLNAYILSQFFIDERYQGKGYGLAATVRILDDMRKDRKFKKVILSYIEGNDTARFLYEKCGFRPTGDRDGNEIIMQLDL